MEVLVQIHSIVRWLVIVGAVAALVGHLSAMGSAGGGGKGARIPGLIFPRLMDLQMLLGIILLVWLGVAGFGYSTSRILHAVIMAIAVVVSHIPQMRKGLEPKAAARTGVITVVVSLLLVIAGVYVLSI